MRDLEQRFEALDLLETPYQWPEIERRAALPQKVRTPAWFHGASVAAATAAAVLVFALGVAAGRWLLGAGSVFEAAFGAGGPLRPATPEDVSVLALVVAGGSGGAVLLGAVIGLLWKWRKKNGRAPARLPETATRGEEMDTLEKTMEKPERTVERVTRDNRWLILAVVVLLAVLVGLGAWLLIDNFVTSEFEQVVLEANAALNAGDDEAYVAHFSSDVLFTTIIDGEITTAYQGEDGQRAWFGRLFETWRSDITGDVVTNGDFATFPNTVSWTSPAGVVGSYEGFHVHRFEGGLIVEHLFIGRSVSGS